MKKNCAFIIIIFLVLFMSSCQTTSYYKTKGLFGAEKRELLVDSVEGVRNSLQETVDVFQIATAGLNVVINVKDKKMEERYEHLKNDYENCKSESDDVRPRIDTMETMSGDFFDEWMEEMQLYTNESFRNASRDKYNKTRKRYTKLVQSFRDVEGKLEPTLNGFRDQVLFLKHNINAQSVTSLEDELVTVEAEIEALIRELQVAIKDTDVFLSSMGRNLDEEEK